jgi:hypothetical protein
MRLDGHFAELAKSQFMAGEPGRSRSEKMSVQPVQPL